MPGVQCRVEVCIECFYIHIEFILLRPPVAPIDTVYKTLDLVKADITKQYSDISRIKEEIDGSGTYTMFAPNDDAWNQLDGVCIIFCLLSSVSHSCAIYTWIYTVLHTVDIYSLYVACRIISVWMEVVYI